MIAAQFLRNLVAAVPYIIHTVLTDNPVPSDCRRPAVEGGIQFTNHARDFVAAYNFGRRLETLKGLTRKSHVFRHVSSHDVPEYPMIYRPIAREEGKQNLVSPKSPTGN